MENRKKQLKNSHRIVSRRSAHNHANNIKQRNSGSIGHCTTSSGSMKAFTFNVDSLVRNHNFAVHTDTNEYPNRKIKVVNTNPAPLYNNPLTQNLLMPGVYLVGGAHFDLNLEKTQANVKFTPECFRFLKKFSEKITPSDRDIVFGNAKKLFRETGGWEKSRIQWLLELERLQENRRSKTKLCEEDYVHIFCCCPFTPSMFI